MDEEIRSPSVGRMPQGTADFDLDALAEEAEGGMAFEIAVELRYKCPRMYHVIKRKAKQMDAYPVMLSIKIYLQILDLVEEEMDNFEFDKLNISVDKVVDELLGLDG